MTAQSPRKQPQQMRAQATVEVILQAATHILIEASARTLTTNRVAERAGVSIGSLYQYFPNKDAILGELIRRKRARLIDAVANATGPDRLSATISAVVAVQLPWARLARALTDAEAFVPLGAETETFQRELFDLLTQAVAPATEVELRDVIALSDGLIEAAGLRGETDTAAVTARVERAVRGYLGQPIRASARLHP